MLKRLRNSLVARNTLWMLLGSGARGIIQATYFVVIARALGADGYGAFVGTAALVGILASFGSLGYENLLVKNAARNPELFERYWGNALMMTLFSGSLLVGVALLLSHSILPSTISPLLVFSIAVADIVFARISETNGRAFQAFQRVRWSAQLEVLLQLTKLLVALGLVLLTTSPTPEQWGLLYLLSAIVSATIGFLIVRRKLGTPRPNLAVAASELKEGFYFSVGLSSQKIYNDIDKTMLARLSTLEATGIYGAAYRLIDVSFTPVLSLMYATYTRFFQHGSAGIQGSLSYARRLLPYAGAYGLLTGVALYLMAPLLPYVLGSDYQDAVEAVRWLALIPFLKSIRFFVADALTGAGFQGLRSAVQVFVALFNVLLNLLLIPTYAWRGAAWASIISDAVLLIALLVVVWYIRRKERV